MNFKLNEKFENVANAREKIIIHEKFVNTYKKNVKSNFWHIRD